MNNQMKKKHTLQKKNVFFFFYIQLIFILSCNEYMEAIAYCMPILDVPRHGINNAIEASCECTREVRRKKKQNYMYTKFKCGFEMLRVLGIFYMKRAFVIAMRVNLLCFSIVMRVVCILRHEHFCCPPEHRDFKLFLYFLCFSFWFFFLLSLVALRPNRIPGQCFQNKS